MPNQYQSDKIYSYTSYSYTSILYSFTSNYKPQTSSIGFFQK